MKHFTSRHFYITLFLSIGLFCMTGCSVINNLDQLTTEANELLVIYPKENYKNVYLDLSHTFGPRPGEYTLLQNKLATQGYSFIDTPETSDTSDSPLLAALKQDIGTLILPEPGISFTDRELRALELFVIFGGRVLTTAPIAGQNSGAFSSLTARFGVSVSTPATTPAGTHYFPEISNMTTASIEAKGVIMKIQDEQLSTGFHEFDKVVMMNPHRLTMDGAHGLFSHNIAASQPDNDNIATAIKTVPKLSAASTKGHFFTLGDSFMAKAPTEGGTGNISKAAYSGGMLTSGNYKFLINLLTQASTSSISDNSGPAMSLQFTSSVAQGSNLTRPVGEINDEAGVAKIVYSLNGQPEIIALNAFEIAGDRYKVHNRMLGGNSIKIPENLLNLGDNRISITTTDQFLNETTQVYNLQYALRSTGQYIHVTSYLPDSQEIDPNMGIIGSGSGESYSNRATFGDYLSNASWDGPIEGCQEFTSATLSPFQTLESAPSGAGRILEMNMPRLEGMIQGNVRKEAITFHFDGLNFNQNSHQIVNHGEIRKYSAAIAGTPTKFSIHLEGTPILSAIMVNMEVIIAHNRPKYCDDDMIRFVSDMIPKSFFVISPNLTEVQQNIANAFLADLENSAGIRFIGRTHLPIFHGDNSEYGNSTTVKFPAGVTHPSLLQGIATIEVIR